MKKLYIFMIAMFLVNGAMAQWVPQNSGTNKDLNSVYFTDANTGYAVGDTGTILKTIDGGAIWTSQTAGTYYNLRSVHFPAADTGFAVGGSGWFGFIMKTVNGGDTWSIVYTSDSIIGGSNCAFNSVYFTDINTGYVVGGFSDIVGTLHPLMFKTTDGGISWTAQSAGTETILNAVHFPVADIGYAVGADWSYGNCALKTINGGLSWELLPLVCQNATSLFFTATDTGYVSCQGSDGASFWKTINGGADWFSIFISWNLFPQHSIYFTDANTGYCVGVGIWKTTDGGSSWNHQNGGGNSVHFPVADTGYAVGGEGVILKTTNGGLPVGINDKTLITESLKIYPNPANDNITIETPTLGSISILNINGQQLHQQEITEPNTTIDVSNFPNGVYLVKLIGEKGVQVGKFIKQ
jgi:photosystem II stability/assembly factor-like uncharacterized protein